MTLLENKLSSESKLGLFVVVVFCFVQLQFNFFFFFFFFFNDGYSGKTSLNNI